MRLRVFFAAIAAATLSCATLSAQTPEEIVAKMNEQLARTEAEGFAMDMVMKIPIVGTVRSHNMINGDNLRMEIAKDGKQSVTWTTPTTKWDYDSSTGEITITNKEPSKETPEADSDLKAFESLTKGYNVILKKETDEAWYFLCKKSRDNKVKDDPKTMDLAVSKATYLPIYLRAKKSMIGIGFENITLGVSAADVTFNPDEFPNAKIVDKR